jgi:para-nitrobenzyl esterase
VPADQASADNVTAATTVLTKYGKLEGAAGRGTSWMWKGVPYAKPPVGGLRWRAPQPPQAWDGIRQSTDKFDMATQLAMSKTWIPQGNIIGGEDCLYLNIWRPQSEEKNLPVYVYLHGGANNFGSARLYDGSGIASVSNMVVVIPQYRLGPLGWFNHPALKDGVTLDEASGNFGTLDTIQALKWIRENIAAFGGDPYNVTLTGQSAGGHNTMNLLISPLARGLFQRALCQSAGLELADVDQGIKMADITIEKLLMADGKAADRTAAAAARSKMTNTETAAYLRGKSAGQLISAQLNDRGSLEFHPAYIDGTVIPAGLLDAIGSGNYNRVPIILGACPSNPKLDNY